MISTILSVYTNAKENVHIWTIIQQKASMQNPGNRRQLKDHFYFKLHFVKIAKDIRFFERCWHLNLAIILQISDNSLKKVFLKINLWNIVTVHKRNMFHWKVNKWNFRNFLRTKKFLDFR